MLSTGLHQVLVGGPAYDGAEETDAPAALAAIAKGLPERLNPAAEDHEDRVEAYWTELVQYAYDEYGIEPDTGDGGDG